MILRASEMPSFGVNGCVKSNGGLGELFGSNGQMDASSSGINVDTEGEIVKESGKSTFKNAGSVDMCILFIVNKPPLV